MKKVLVSLLSIALIGCSQPILNNTSEYSDLDKEYSQFTTKALTQSYLKKKMDKWLSDGKYSKNLVREIEYAKFKHKDLLKDIVALQPTMFDSIIANTGVNQKRVESPFENYIEYIDPYPSSVTANSATNITTSSFTAHWTSNTKATSYKLFVNGSEVYSGANTSFDVTNLSFGTTPTYYVKAINSAGESPNSNTISVTLNPSTVTASNATNITTSSFTANWTAVSGVTSYKLTVDSNTPIDVGNVTSSNVTSLTAGTTHTYSVQAVNSGGTGSSSNNISVTLLPSAPVATDGTSITTSSFTANWGAVSGATSYKLFVNGTEVYSGASTSCNVTSLASGTYTYYVKAVNSAGESANSNTISVTLNPSTVTALDATNITQTSFTANWSPVSGATSYKLKVDNGAFTDVGLVTSKSITSLTAGTTHTYSVQAVNAGGTGSSSNIISVTLNPAAPAVPTTLAATNITSTSFTANWNSVSGATSYKLKVDTGSWNDVGNVTSSNVTGLTAGTTHNYYVEASNLSGTSTSSTAQAVTLLPSAPTALSAINLTETGFTAKWSSVTGATSYKLFIDGIETYTGSNLSYSITNLPLGSTHTYYVKTFISSTASENSNTISVSLSGFTTFLDIQSIPTNGADYLESFVIDSNTYLGISNVQGSVSSIYKWNTSTNQFTSYQNLPTSSSNHIKSFKIGTDTYLSVMDYYSNAIIYKWNTSTSQFATFQTIPTNGGLASNFFQIGSNNYIVFANQSGSTSPVYKFNTQTNQFDFIQNISTGACYGAKTLVINNETYLLIANFSYDTRVYKWNNTTGQFVEYQSILIYETTRDYDTFVINNETYFAAANWSTNSKIYKWNKSNNQFEYYQTIPVASACNVLHFVVGSTHYISIGNESGGNGNLKIYKWDETNNQFVDFFSTNVAYIASTYFTIGTNHYLGFAHRYDPNLGYVLSSKIYKLN